MSFRLPCICNLKSISVGEETLNHTMRISIEGPDELNSEDLDSWKEKKNSKTNDITSMAACN